MHKQKLRTGVFISDVTITDTGNGEINYYQETLLSSKVTLESSTSTVTYEITLYNNSNQDYVYIGELIDENAYSNENIGYTLNGLTKYETTIAPKESLKFTITFAYIEGADTSNNVLESIINFRFKEQPILELSNNGTTYTLENIYPGYTTQEYEFTVTNYTATDTNTVPMTYSLESTITDGSPLELKIYNESGEEVIGEISIAGDGTAVEHTYTLKIIWDSSYDIRDYKGQEYNCNIALKAKPEDEKYLDYTITKGFNIDISTLAIVTIPISTAEQLLKIGSNEEVTIDGETYTFTADGYYELQNDITFAVADYIEAYPDAFKTETTTEITTETGNLETNYETANSTSNPYYTYVAPSTGLYKLEVWGAQGGTYNSKYATGGLGGYSVGTITLNEGDNLYVYVGGKGSYGTTSTYSTTTGGGYNGGGAAAYKGGTGGGATDIRFSSGTWSDSTSLLSRVIVAGGGGGAFADDEDARASGGHGGGKTGGSGIASSSAYAGGGATQTAGGTAGTGSSTLYNGKAGTFGKGGSTGWKYDSIVYYSNGAGRRRLVWWRRSRK